MNIDFWLLEKLNINSILFDLIQRLCLVRNLCIFSVLPGLVGKLVVVTDLK